MGSYVQVIVGGMLLVFAFLVGRHIEGEPILATNKPVEAPIELRASVADTTIAPAVTKPEPQPTNQLQKSLRDRILGERQNRQLKPSSVDLTINPTPAFSPTPSFESAPQFESVPQFEPTPEFEPETPPFTLSEQDVVMPDFGRYDSTHPDSLDRKTSESLATVNANPKLPAMKPFPFPKPNVDSIADPMAATNLLPQRMPERDLRSAPRSLLNKAPKKIHDGVIMGPEFGDEPEFGSQLSRQPRRLSRRPTQPEQSLQFQPLPDRRSFADNANTAPVSKPVAVSPKQITGNLVPVRHRESRIMTEAQEFKSYTTVFGDTLHGLSNRFFGKPNYYLDIYLANKDLFSNPSEVPVNVELRIPMMEKIVDHSGLAK